jgi:hypothetical protein
MPETTPCPFCGWPVEAPSAVASGGSAALQAQLDSVMRLLQAIVDERERGCLLALHPRSITPRRLSRNVLAPVER